MVMKLIRASSESARARRASVAALVVAAALLAGCATNPGPPTGESYDPFEPVNRQIFAFNEKVDEFVLAPAGEFYREVVPSPIRDSVRAFLRHLSTPVILANDILQGDIEAAGATTARFFLNSMTLGLVDLAALSGLPYRKEDFGQTLGVYTITPGPYVVLPLLGPSSVRDVIGLVVDRLIDPLASPVDIFDSQRAATQVGLARGVTSAVDFRAVNGRQIDGLRRDSLDYYAAVRTIYLQRRQSDVLNGALLPNVQAGPNDDLFNEFAPNEGDTDRQSGKLPD